MKNYRLSKYTSCYENGNELNVYNSLTGLKGRIYDQQLINQIHKLSNSLLQEGDVDQRLIDAHIAVEENIDEVLIAEDVISAGLSRNESKFRLIILPTRECNFRCKYCYETKKHLNMTFEMADNLIHATKKYLEANRGIRFLQLEWFGGEPLLSYEINIYVSEALKQYSEEHSINFSMSITTNGYLLTKERAERLVSLNLFSYQITVDSFAKYHDELRILKNGGPTWDVIYKNLLDLKTIDNENLSVTIRINYHLNMVEEIPEFIKMIKRDFDKRFLVYAIRINPTPEFEKEFTPVNIEAESFALEYIIDAMKENGLSIERYMTNMSPTASACYARMNYVYIIDADGTLKKCTEYLDEDYWNNIGTIKNGFFEVDYYKHTQWLYPKKDQIVKQKCYDCVDYPNCCGGLCPAQWLINKNTVCNPLRKFNGLFLEQYINEKYNKE